MSISRRLFTKISVRVLAAFMISALPFDFVLSIYAGKLSVPYAFANNGNGNGGGGNGGRNGNGNSDNGQGNGSNKSRAAGFNSSGATSGDAATSDREQANGAVNVRHYNGITESMSNGRYTMKDAKGRTIINRPATSDDARRLDGFLPH